MKRHQWATSNRLWILVFNLINKHAKAKVPKQYGGIVIERVHLTWQPYDFFGVTAGRFLTPFGIWNIDHGAPVLLPIAPPYMMIYQTVPLAQTGLQIHGRLFPMNNSYLDYALTLSNGRGPTEAVYDWEDDKAVGLRLRLSYEIKDFNIAVGGYGYYGRSTGAAKQLSLERFVTDEELIVDKIKNEESTELDLSMDVLVELYGVRLQFEYVRQLVMYDVRPPRTLPVVEMVMSEGVLQPDYVSYNLYALLAWELPLESLLREKKIIVYFMGEKCVIEDFSPDMYFYILRMGINYKPNAYLVLKSMLAHTFFPELKEVNGSATVVGAQVAVSF